VSVAIKKSEYYILLAELRVEYVGYDASSHPIKLIIKLG